MSACQHMLGPVMKDGRDVFAFIGGEVPHGRSDRVITISIEADVHEEDPNLPRSYLCLVADQDK